MSFIYLAGPIDRAQGNGAVAEARRDALSNLRTLGAAVFDPASAYKDPGNSTESIYRVNQAALHEAHGVLALLPPGMPHSTGTPMEILESCQRGCPVAVLGGSESVMLQNMPVRVFDSGEFSKAAEWIVASAREPRGRAIRWIGDEGCEPRKGLAGDTGFDLICAEDVRVPIDGFKDIDCGVDVEMPPDVWGMITGRSSTLRKRGLLVSQGIIDNGYRGRLFAGVWNLSEEVVRVLRGERIAQLIPFDQTSIGMQMRRVERLAPSLRGDRAFGSTGL